MDAWWGTPPLPGQRCLLSMTARRVIMIDVLCAYPLSTHRFFLTCIITESASTAQFLKSKHVFVKGRRRYRQTIETANWKTASMSVYIKIIIPSQQIFRIHRSIEAYMDGSFNETAMCHITSIIVRLTFTQTYIKLINMNVHVHVNKCIIITCKYTCIVCTLASSGVFCLNQ